MPSMEALLNDEGNESIPVRIEPIVAAVVSEMCRGCGDCEAVCDYSAINVETQTDGSRIARVDVTICKGCGTCVSVCPTGAARLAFFAKEDIESELEAFLAK